MFKHILIPVDGSEFSDRAIDTGIRFARSIGAKVTGFIAEPEYEVPLTSEIVSRRFETIGDHREKVSAHAEAVLKRIGERARAEGVDFASDFIESDAPVDAIVGAAAKHGCDLILMASHGRRGLDRLIHGSTAEGVSTHTHLPVLILH